MGLAEAAIALTALGTVGSAAGQYQQGKQQAAQAKYQAAMASNNATIAEQNARDVAAAGKAEEQRQRIANSQQMGQLRAQIGASGVDMGSGSALDASADQAMTGEFNALGVRDNWQRQQNNSLQQANDFRSQSALYGTAAKNASSGGLWGAATTLLGGAGSVAGQWYTLNKPPTTTTTKNPNSSRPWGM